MSIRGNRAFSLIKTKKGSDDACVLQNVRPIDDSNLIGSSANLGRFTSLRERSFSLTNRSKSRWGSALSSSNINSFCYNNNYNSCCESYKTLKEVDSSKSLDSQEDHSLIESEPDSSLSESFEDRSDSFDTLTSEKEWKNKKGRNQSVDLDSNCSGKNQSKLVKSGQALNGQVKEADTAAMSLPRRSLDDQQALLLLEESFSVDSTSTAESNPAKDRVKSSKIASSTANSAEFLKEFNSRPKCATTGSKMANKIQRTIRALYDGNGNKKESAEKLGVNENDPEPLKLRPVQLGPNLTESSPKQDKRSTRRSRSPKSSRRITVPVKDIDGSRRFKWRGSVNRIVRKFGQGQSLLQGATFDVLLEDCPPSPNNELVPFIVDVCCRIVEQHGLSFTGIYRVPGNSGTLAALQEEMNQRGTEAIDLENDERFCDISVVSSLLKSFLRKLPDPLFTNELYDDFIAVNRKNDPEERLNGIRRLVHMLPGPHYETLKFLINHLRKVSDHSEVNKMEIRNLAIVFGPTLVRSTATDNMATMVTDMSDQCRIVESVLRHVDWFFSDDKNASLPVTVQLPPRLVQQEPTSNIDHLLANVGRTPGDVSDTASESSRSKASVVSEKDSFSRDVIESLFGSGRKWVNHPQQGVHDVKESSEDSEDYSFKATNTCRKSPVPSSPRSPSSVLSAMSFTGTKPAASDQQRSDDNAILDYNARLRDFYLENMDWLSRLDINRPLPHFSFSSAESSPQVTPRTSVFGLPQPVVQRGYPRPRSRRLSDGKLPPSPNIPSAVGFSRQNSTPQSSPLLQRQPQFYKEGCIKSSVPSGFWPTNIRPGLMYRSRSELSSRESLMADVESDSDNSIYLGDTLDEKLRNLTNFNKLEQRTTRRQTTSECHGIKALSGASLKSMNKNLCTLGLGDPGSNENLFLFSRKSTKELYQERKAQRQQHRSVVKPHRSNRKEYLDLSRCTSDENVYALSDPSRSSARTDIDIMTSALRRQRANIKRRHTFGSGDFPDQGFLVRSHSASLQNIAKDIYDITFSRFRPQLRASAPSLSPPSTNARFVWSGAPNRTFDRTRTVESYI